MSKKIEHNRLFVGYKPTGVSSNNYLSKIRKKISSKTAGYSGTLDPFAKGVLVIADGKYTKLFRFFDKSPKIYRATLWLGAFSESLDIERINKIEQVKPIEKGLLETKINELAKIKEIIPPKFSAKKINGKKAYELARKGKDFEIKPMHIEIFDIKLLCYSHPFVTFEISVSEGTYIRSLGAILATLLGCNGSLSSLERLSEGKFNYDQNTLLDPLDYISLPQNLCTKTEAEILNGKKISIDELSIKSEGFFLLKFEHFFSIIQVQEECVSYILNGIENYKR